jgi:hypothetical protein
VDGIALNAEAEFSTFFGECVNSKHFVLLRMLESICVVAVDNSHNKE